MKIKFSVEEYFNELKLMDEQYGQEEGLYPWIYMLLQMAECKKKKILKDFYNNISIIDVHKDRKKTNSLPLSSLLKDGFPDFVITANMSSTYVCGCVEIKKIESNKLTLSTPLKNEYCINTIKYEFHLFEKSNGEKANEKKSISIKNYPHKNSLTENIKDTIRKTNGDVDIKTESFNKYYHLDIATHNPSNSIKILDSLMDHDRLSASTDTYELSENSKKLSIDVWDPSNGPQLVRHLNTCKKVLYTDGLVFYFLILDTANNGLIHVKKIADLFDIYKSYENYFHSSTHTESLSDILLSAEAEWDKLISGLTSIDWHKAPVASLNSASKENNPEEVQNAQGKAKDPHH